MKIASINIYGQTGLNPTKLLEIEHFIEYHRLDVVCLQETNISDITFSECKMISKRFNVIYNNSSTGYGTCILVTKRFSTSNICKDTSGRLICVDIDSKITIANLYLHSGTDQSSRIDREKFINDIIPNILIYKKQIGFMCGDFNSITVKKDSLIHPDQKISKSFGNLINLYELTDVFRKLYPNAIQFSRYYTWRGVKGATRIDRIYS